MIIRITREGNVNVSAPINVSTEKITQFIQTKESWIQKHLDRIMKSIKKNKITFENGDKIVILGKIYALQIIISEENKVEIEKSQEESPVLFLYVTMYNDWEFRRMVLYEWLKDKLFSILYNLNKKYGEITGFYPGEIKIREMKSLWGSCNVRKRKISYNFHLIEKPIEAIEYVVLHEISHIPYPNHQEKFWKFLEGYMPDWKARKKLLKER
jgi:predicted metal-dependent hydrolase